MKIEHLLEAYEVNSIHVLNTYMNDGKAGTINFDEGISCSYLLDNESNIVSMNMFFNCITKKELKLENQLDHVLKILNIMQNTIMLLSNIPLKECNMILSELGLFDNTFKESVSIKHLGFAYSIKAIDGLICLSINELNL